MKFEEADTLNGWFGSMQQQTGGSGKGKNSPNGGNSRREDNVALRTLL